MKRLTSFILVLALMLLCLPITALAELTSEEQELYNTWLEQLGRSDRIEGMIAFGIEDGVTEEEAYNIMYEALEFAYDTADKAVLENYARYSFSVATITVPDEVILDTMLLLNRNKNVRNVSFDFYIYPCPDLGGDESIPGDTELTAEEQELYNKWLEYFDNPDRIEGVIALYFNEGLSDEEKYEIMYTACEFAYGITDRELLAGYIDNGRFDIATITVPDEVILDTMLLLNRYEEIRIVDFDGYAYVPGFDDESIPGDTDGNGLINASDYLIIKRIVLGTYEGNVLSSADVNNDGEINASDYTLVRRMVLGTYAG